jgi:hypothetical protein
MSRHATLDPALIKPASDKRKAPSLIAPSTVKNKRTKKATYSGQNPFLPKYNAILHSDHLYLCTISN